MIITLIDLKKEEKEEDKVIITQHTLKEHKKFRFKILLAEDHPINQKLIMTTVKKAGFNIECVNNGKEALEAHKKNSYDMILMDVQMPVMDGLSAASEIRKFELELNRHTPIVALTAHAMSGDKEKCLAAGMDDYLTKPINTNKLITLIKNVMNCEREEKPFGGDMKKDTKTKGSPVDLEEALVRFGNDMDFLVETIEEFNALLEGQLDEIAGAIRDTKMDVIQNEAHKIKGAAANLSAGELAGLAENLESSAKKGDISGAPSTFERIKNERVKLIEFAKKIKSGKHDENTDSRG